MAAVAKNPSFAKKVGLKPSVGEHFLTADKGKKFKEGGEMKESKEMMQKEVAFMKKKGAPKSMLKHEMAEAKGMKKGGMACSPTSMKKTAGVEATKVVNKHEKKMHGMKAGGTFRASANGIAKKGLTKGTQVKMNKGGAC